MKEFVQLLRCLGNRNWWWSKCWSHIWFGLVSIPNMEANIRLWIFKKIRLVIGFNGLGKLIRRGRTLWWSRVRIKYVLDRSLESIVVEGLSNSDIWTGFRANGPSGTSAINPSLRSFGTICRIVEKSLKPIAVGLIFVVGALQIFYRNFIQLCLLKSLPIFLLQFKHCEHSLSLGQLSFRLGLLTRQGSFLLRSPLNFHSFLLSLLFGQPRMVCSASNLSCSAFSCAIRSSAKFWRSTSSRFNLAIFCWRRRWLEETETWLLLVALLFECLLDRFPVPFESHCRDLPSSVSPIELI